MGNLTDAVTIGLMIKYWEPGKVKTRLGQTIGMEQAAALHRLFVSQLCSELSGCGSRRVVSVSPDESERRFRHELESWGLDSHWDTMPQGGGDLGHRISHWFQAVLDDPHNSPSAILLGADCPTIDAGVVAEATERLRDHDAVAGPALDGGYYLIGLRGPWIPGRHDRLFVEMPWSTDQVLAITRERIKSAGLTVAELQPREDIDTQRELDNLIASGHDDDRWTELIAEIERLVVRPSLTERPSP